MITFDTSQYEAPVDAPIVDVFRKASSDGSYSAGITADALPKWVDSANERHSRGEHCPLVIGHTINGAPEVNQPPKAGWITGPYRVETNHPEVKGPVIVGKHWIQKETTVVLNGAPVKLSARQVVEMWPRRSAELWFRDKKIDPVALLGATTPERELGVIRLAADSGVCVSYTAPGRIHLKRDCDMSDEKLPDTDSAPMKQLEAIVMQLQQQFTAQSEQMAQIQAILAQGQQPQDQQGGMSDDELDQLLAQHAGGGEAQSQPEKPVKNERDAELESLRLKLSRREADDKIKALEAKGVQLGLSDEKERETLVSDLIAMPDDMQDRLLTRLSRTRSLPVPGAGLAGAVAAAAATAGKREVTPEDTPRLLKLARERGQDYEVVARAEGFLVGGK